MATAYTPEVTGTGIRARVQKVGGYLAGMVMPNIGAFIAWGLITALFIPTGWLPDKELGELVDPTIKFLLPILIGYTGGRMVHGQRGAVVGAVGTIGVVVGADQPMFLGAMIIGPLTAYVLKLFDGLVEDRVRPGFEMLVDNFSAGIIGAAMAVLGRTVIGPVMHHLTTWAGDSVNWLVDHDVLPAASVLIEPAKVLFLNNAINHGVLGPLGVQQAAEHGKSILFTLESNPGPGLGVLLAYFFFGPRRLRPTVPAAIIIQFLGGIHEIYFPYILMKPRMILATIAGGATGVSIFLIFHTGLVATPAPGSIFAYFAQTPKGVNNWIGIYTGIAASAAVSFFVGALLLGFGKLAEPAAADGAEGAETPEASEEAEAPEPASASASASAEASGETKSSDEQPATEKAGTDGTSQQPAAH
ncbi:PTS mannitol transporter subunit IICB [Actinomadura barringtoniae]|uniref:PTS mannitol transporter subunit IICB n=1 Tax=Actinomadura barringtoniae TaxID=1427535 RepID=A0A939PIR2_9ACTN|nr:PTS mannitol transporter subunit IICB [Actinomadura barringtoniae]MBO2449296.1 PTS mannitol transporter subunit IICB [Actinomadura barringtoniae]